jgi:1-acyl-sn-glycerol-3-phosphate acyltransferase
VTFEEAHRRARERGPSRFLYALVRALFVPFFRIWFRLRIVGAEHIPESGAAVVTPNHKSFWDSFFIGAATPRHVRFMGKVELFEKPYGRLLVALGAFPVRRGQSDAEAHKTALVILEQGGLLSLFPEGTRIREPDELGPPRRGAARLAIEAGTPLVPAAITGTDHLWLGPLPRPKRVQVAFSPPIPVAELEATPETAGRVLEEEVWPEVESQFRRLLSRRGAVAALLAALGIGGAAVGGARIRERRARERKPWRRLKRRAKLPGPSGHLRARFRLRGWKRG